MSSIVAPLEGDRLMILIGYALVTLLCAYVAWIVVAVSWGAMRDPKTRASLYKLPGGGQAKHPVMKTIVWTQWLLVGAIMLWLAWLGVSELVEAFR